MRSDKTDNPNGVPAEPPELCSYGTSTPKEPKNDHIGLIVTLSLLVILLCTVQMLQPPRVDERQMPAAEASQGDDPAAAPEICVTLQDGEEAGIPALAFSDAGGQTLSEQALLQAMSASVVRVEIDGYGSLERCAGVIFTERGDVLAGCGDLRQACGIRCLLADGRTLPAVWLGWDEATGLSLLRLTAEDLTPARFVRSEAQTVYAVGYADGESVLSCLRGTLTQTDGGLQSSAFFPDSPGAPLCDGSGAVLGLCGAASEDGTAAAALSSEQLQAALSRILAGNPAAGLWLGFDVGEIPSSLVSYYDYPGVLWIRSLPDERLSEAGFYAFDILLTADDRTLTSWDDLNEVLAAHSPGDPILLTLYRDGRILTASVQLRAR